MAIEKATDFKKSSDIDLSNFLDRIHYPKRNLKLKKYRGSENSLDSGLTGVSGVTGLSGLTGWMSNNTAQTTLERTMDMVKKGIQNTDAVIQGKIDEEEEEDNYMKDELHQTDEKKLLNEIKFR